MCWGHSRVEIFWWQVPLTAERRLVPHGGREPGVVVLASVPQGGGQDGAGKAPECLQEKSVSRRVGVEALPSDVSVSSLCHQQWVTELMDLCCHYHFSSSNL